MCGLVRAEGSSFLAACTLFLRVYVWALCLGSQRPQTCRAKWKAGQVVLGQAGNADKPQGDIRGTDGTETTTIGETRAGSRSKNVVARAEEGGMKEEEASQKRGGEEEQETEAKYQRG